MTNQGRIITLLSTFQELHIIYKVVWIADNVFELYVPVKSIFLGSDLDKIVKAGYKIRWLRVEGDFIKISFTYNVD